jgi:hypothetical protein
MIPLMVSKKIGGATNVLHHLAHQMVLSGGKPVPATAIRTGCADHKTRIKALRRYESLGLLEIVDWRGNGAAPIVRLTF